MGILSSSVTITRYQVKGQIQAPVLETIAACLRQNAITEIDSEAQDKSVGWTSFQHPFQADFESSSFVYGPYLVFSLRIDKKSVPSKIVHKHFQVEMARQLAESGREYLSRNEKKALKEHVTDVLYTRIPATPHVYDLMWNLEGESLWFFSSQKAANEELETLFTRSFKLNLIRLFPFTIADLALGLSDAERDAVSKLSPTKFME